MLEQINKRSKNNNNTYHYHNFFKKPESKGIMNYFEISKREVMKRSDDCNDNNNLNKMTYNNEYKKK